MNRRSPLISKNAAAASPLPAKTREIIFSEGTKTDSTVHVDTMRLHSRTFGSESEEQELREALAHQVHELSRIQKRDMKMKELRFRSNGTSLIETRPGPSGLQIVGERNPTNLQPAKFAGRANEVSIDMAPITKRATGCTSKASTV
jgi:hypothetical protein